MMRRFGRVDVLVNQAGYALRGAVEELADSPVQAMIDVNVHGVLRMIRADVPYMRRQQAGRIINISSIADRIALPVNSTYAETKFAVEALSDALRLVWAPFGIQVVLIAPGSMRRAFARTVQAHSGALLANAAAPYYTLYQHDLQLEAERRRQEAGPHAVSAVVQRAMEAPRPRARYLAAVPFAARVTLHLGDNFRDLIFCRALQIVPPPA